MPLTRRKDVPTRYDPSVTNAYAQAARRAIHQPHTSMGAAGHWIHLLSVAAPLVIAEVIKDPDKKWRALRLASVGGALLSEAVWTLGYRTTDAGKRNRAPLSKIAKAAAANAPRASTPKPRYIDVSPHGSVVASATPKAETRGGQSTAARRRPASSHAAG